MKDKNAPMFPTYYSDSGEGIIPTGFEPHGGISVRLYVATQILSGMALSSNAIRPDYAKHNKATVDAALTYADLLIKASRKDEE